MIVLKEAVSISTIYILHKVLKVNAGNFMPSGRLVSVNIEEIIKKAVAYAWQKYNGITGERQVWEKNVDFAGYTEAKGS